MLLCIDFSFFYESVGSCVFAVYKTICFFIIFFFLVEFCFARNIVGFGLPFNLQSHMNDFLGEA